MKKIFTISSGTRCGKDTLADLIKEFYENRGEKVTIIPYAGLLKRFVGNMLSMDASEIDKKKDTKLKIKDCECEDMTFRDFIVIAAKALREEVADNIFMQEYKKAIKNYDIVIIPDLRFKHEMYDILKFREEHPDILVRTILMESNLKSCYVNKETDEVLDMVFDHIVENREGLLFKLKDQVYKILHHIRD